MSSGSETEKGNPTTTATEGGSDAANEEYRLVYVRKLSAPNDPEALRLARDVLKEADNNDELCVQASGDCRAVANPEGFQYAGYNSLNNETKTFREGNAQSEAAWNCYVAIRCRFMASYERKCKGEGGITRNEVGMIETGNQKAHGGDCQMDSLVVKSQAGARMDTYTSLYGMAPDEMERISKSPKESSGTYTYQGAPTSPRLDYRRTQHTCHCCRTHPKENNRCVFGRL